MICLPPSMDDDRHDRYLRWSTSCIFMFTVRLILEFGIVNCLFDFGIWDSLLGI